MAVLSIWIWQPQTPTSIVLSLSNLTITNLPRRGRADTLHLGSLGSNAPGCCAFGLFDCLTNFNRSDANGKNYGPISIWFAL